MLKKQIRYLLLLLFVTNLNYGYLDFLVQPLIQPLIDRFFSKKYFQDGIIFYKFNKPKNYLSKIILTQEIRDFLNIYKEVNDFIQSTAIKKSGVAIQPKHLLFNGQPGTEKTQLASYLANELKSSVYIVNIDSILSQKKPLKTMSFLLKKTHKNPTIIILDEIESLLDNPALYHQFLNYLQNCPHPIFATSNVDNIDIKFKSLCRPGRFNVVHIPLLKDEYRKTAITNKFTQLFKANPEQKTFDLIEKHLPQGEISGAYINDFSDILFSLTKGKTENINEKVIKDSVNYFNQKGNN